MTQTTIYKPTFLQKFLGRNYKWWYCLIYNIKLSLAYTTTSVFVIIRDFLPLVVSFIIYGSFLEAKDFATYFLLANIFFKICVIMWDISWDFRNDIKMGFLVSKLMRPSNIFLHYLCVTIGANFYSLFINLIILFFTAFFTKANIPFSLNIFPALGLLILGIFIFYSVEVIIGSITFYSTETAQLIETKNFLIPLLAGSLVFLDTNSFTKIFIFSPFAFAVYHPTQIYLGKYSNLEILYVFLGGIAWCVALYFLAKLVFKMGLKRNEAVGL
jgi:ABC-2 type transport system permease protein